MDKRISQRSGKLLAAAVASVGLAGIASQADAGLVVDIRALSATGTGNSIVPGGKSILLGAADGRTVTLGVFARVSGTNTVQNTIDINGDGTDLVTVNDDTMQTLVGAFTSGNGGLKGNMGSAVAGNNTVYDPRFTPFSAAGSTNGVFADFDSDGDLDLGATGTDPTNMWAIRAASPTTAGLSPVSGKYYAQGTSAIPNTNETLVDATTNEVRIGTLRFIATGGAGSTDLAFISRSNADAASLWFEDGINTGKNALNSTFSPGAPVSISLVPEPASIGLLGLATLGLLARRRKQD